jgi:hypothetical protein
MICIGPILLIVGIVLLGTKNNYDEYVSKYNDAVGNFNAHYRSLVLATTANVGGNWNLFPLSSGSDSPLSPQFSGTLPDSSTQGVTTSGLSYPLKSQTNVDLSSSRSANITFTPPSSGQGSTFSPSSVSFTLPAVGSSTTTYYLTCSSSQIDRRTSCQSVCEQKSTCGVYSGSGSYCYSSSSCSGACRVVNYDSLQCSQFDINNATGQLTRNNNLGCIYPTSGWTQPASCTQRNSVPVLFMNSQDPFIQIQKITQDSSFSFGLTKAQQRNIGLALLAVGASITGLVICLAVALYKSIYKTDQSATTVYAAFGKTYVPVNTNPQNVAFSTQAVYGQQPAVGNYYDQNAFQPQQQQPVYYQQVPPPPQQQQMMYQPGYSAMPPPNVVMMPPPQQQYNPQYSGAPNGYGAPPAPHY